MLNATHLIKGPVLLIYWIKNISHARQFTNDEEAVAWLETSTAARWKLHYE